MRRKQNEPNIGTLCMAILLFITAGCQTNTTSSTADALHHHNWWNYYEAGIQLSRDHRYEEAQLHFEQALGLKSGAVFGYETERWRARTYGMHFINDYFPHRELGIALYFLGETDRAIQALEESVRQQPSGRAKYYLNLARKQKTAAQPTAKPEVVLTGEKKWVKDRNLSVTGTARSKNYISELRINDRPQFIELAADHVPFKQNVALKPGPNRIYITASDLSGQQSTKALECIADWEPPAFFIDSAKTVNGKAILKATCTDNIGLQRVAVTNHSYTIKSDASFSFTVTTDFQTPIVIEAEDLAGNRIQTLVTQTFWAEQPSSAQAFNAQLVLVSGEDEKDRLPPALKISENTSLVFTDEFYLDGYANDGGGLAGLRINGEELLPKDRKGAIHYSFARRIPLNVGANTFEIKAIDAENNVTRKTLTVVRQIPASLSDQYRLTMGLPPPHFPENSIVSENAKRYLEKELLHQPIRFRLVERDEGWDFLLQELELSFSDLSDRQIQLKSGRLLPAELILLTTVLDQGDGATFYAKVADVETGQILATADVYSDYKNSDLEHQIGGLVLKIEQAFPLVNGHITAVKKSRAYLDVGQEQGVRNGTRFIAAAPNDAENVRQANDRFIELYVTQTKTAQGEAQVRPQDALNLLKEGDAVYAR